jgi:Phosphoadenosine phosphosulfate reductase family
LSPKFTKSATRRDLTVRNQSTFSTRLPSAATSLLRLSQSAQRNCHLFTSNLSTARNIMTTATDLNLDELNARFEHAPAEDVIAWAHEAFGTGLVTLCAMTSDTALVDLLSRRAPGAKVVFLETGHHFSETHDQLNAVQKRYAASVNFSTATSGLAPGILWQSDPNACCNARKVEPMEAALAGNTAWITGVRRADSEVRAGTPIWKPIFNFMRFPAIPCSTTATPPLVANRAPAKLNSVKTSAQGAGPAKAKPNVGYTYERRSCTRHVASRQCPGRTIRT